MITPESAEIMQLLGMGAAELDIPTRYSMFEDVCKFFSDPKSAGRQILKILGKQATNDSLEAVWRYVRLQNEKTEVIKGLNPDDFQGEIAEEIKQGVLSLEHILLVESDMAARESSPIKNDFDFHGIREVFQTVKDINQTLEQYA